MFRIVAALVIASVPLAAQAREAVVQSAADFASDRLSVTVEGKGPDVILIPGLTSSPEIWQGTVDHLGGKYRVHRVKVAGFAGLPAGANGKDGGPVSAPVAEEIARYIREKKLAKPAVIGHSMGGSIALMLAARHPDAVGKVMAVDMIPFMGNMFGGPAATPESVKPIADQIYAGMANGPREAYDAQATAAINNMIDSEALRAGPIAHMKASDQKVAAAAYRELVTTDLRPELAKIGVPVTVLYVAFKAPGMTAATTDGIYRASYAALKGATLKRIDDSAHFIMLDQPAAFNAEVDAFLAAK